MSHVLDFYGRVVASLVTNQHCFVLAIAQK